MKPMLACDADQGLLRFPLIAQPKIDGVRALHLRDQLLARSLKPIRNKHTAKFFTHEILAGFDGELVAAAATHPDLCRLTTSATSTIEGTPAVDWHIFDYNSRKTSELPYEKRLELVTKSVELVKEMLPAVGARLHVIPSTRVTTLAEVEEQERLALAAGYEGLILRDPRAVYKHGRSTARENGLLRIKAFLDSEAVIISVAEGTTNENPAQTNELGRTFRSSHQENQQPNGRIGSLRAIAQKSVFDGEKLVIEKGQLLTISPGNMDVDSRIFYWQHRQHILNRTIKFKFFPKGIKDAPRFPTFVCFRDDTDM